MKKIIYTIFFLSFFVSPQAEAFYLTSQLTKTDTVATSSGSWFQNLGNGISGTSTQLTMRMKLMYDPGGDHAEGLSLGISCYTDAGYTSACGGSTATSSYTSLTYNVANDYTFLISTHFDPLYYYRISASSWDEMANDVFLYGYSAGSGCGGTCSGSTYYILENASYSLVTPILPNSATYTQNPVNFTGLYTQTGTFNELQFYFSNTTQGYSFYESKYLGEINIVDEPYDYDITLPLSGSYDYQVRLRDNVTSSSTPWVDGNSFALGTTTAKTATSTNYFTDPTPLSCDTLDLGCYIKVAFAWLFVPSQESINQFKELTLENSYPFSYAYDMANVRDEIFDGSATSTSISIPFGAFGSITIFSESLLAGITFLPWMRTIIGYLAWIIFAEFVYLQILKAHNKNV